MLVKRFRVQLMFAAAVVGALLLTAAGEGADRRNRPPKSPIAKAAAKAKARAAAKLAAAAEFQKAKTGSNKSRTDPPRIAKANKANVTPAAAKAATAISVAKPTAGKPLPLLTPVAPVKAAAEIDRRLADELAAVATATASPAERAPDEVFLRRVSLDIAGRLPTPGEITSFALDPAPDKRALAVERLLADPAHGENWGRYWRDVIMYRRSDDRALVAAAGLEQYLVEQFNKNTPWDEIARSFVTATGDVRENGNTAIFMAQMGETADIAAEVSRIFIGIQIQCAQCHNHPTDRWQRSQFHELAAFFSRIGVRPKRGDGPLSFEVASVDRAPLVRRANNGRPRAHLEHFMPDLQDPSAQGTRMEPVFFVTGQKLSPGATDTERRETIAGWITSRSNPWFAKALVNRIWSELAGEGFHEPVDDIGPDREATAPKTLDYVAAQFAANKHDIKWLFRTITATEAYQRASRSRRGPEETPLLANAAQRLRGDQLFTAITSVVGAAPSVPTARGGRVGLRDPRFVFNAVFGFDPSVGRDDVAGSIPQALAMMNSPQIAAGMNGARPGSFLGKLLKDESDDEAVAVELYLRTLSREPTADELSKCLAHVKSSGTRSEGFEDVLWALLNSAEFSHRK